ncbi:MAG: hypothetical protein AUK44_00850 [Porphyromonadaceae bacterium CG2_30_38_12]|nr:MAG: hypothetical protein AUK44_00850 [Porphyromonadaceae bacterium CG2_30_38_12]
MHKQNTTTKHTGLAIAIAWPETYCKQAGYFPDNILNFIGIAKHHYYKVGHAALVLVNVENGYCSYFDFGRYHTPWQTGRARSVHTDPLLKIHTCAKFNKAGSEIINFNEILTELQLNPECHGEGAIHASYGRIDYEKSLAKAYWFQEKSPFAYGPFRYKGSNCSRFVNDCLVAGKPNLWSLVKLRLLVPLTPTTLNNVHAFNHKTIIPKLQKNVPFCPLPLPNKQFLKTTLPQPERATNIPHDAQWLSGEGCGSWFHLKATDNDFEITRYNANGALEFNGKYRLASENSFNILVPFQVTYLSHFEKVSVVQNTKSFEFSNCNHFVLAI